MYRCSQTLVTLQKRHNAFQFLSAITRFRPRSKWHFAIVDHVQERPFLYHVRHAAQEEIGWNYTVCFDEKRILRPRPTEPMKTWMTKSTRRSLPRSNDIHCAPLCTWGARQLDTFAESSETEGCRRDAVLKDETPLPLPRARGRTDATCPASSLATQALPFQSALRHRYQGRQDPLGREKINEISHAVCLGTHCHRVERDISSEETFTPPEAVAGKR